MAPFPDDVEDVHDFRFYQGTDDDRFRYAGVRFLRRAQAARQEGDAQVGDDGLNHEVPLARFEDDLRLETDFLTVLDDFVVQVEVVAVEDQRFIGQLLEGNRLFLGQDVVPVDDDVHRVLGQEERFKVLFLRLRADDAQVDEAFLDADFDFLRAVFVEVQFDLRVFLLERPQEVGEDRCARDRRQADEDRPLFEHLNSFSKSVFKCSNMKTTRLAWERKIVPASVSSTALALRMKRTTPSSSSRALMVRLMADWEMCSVRAALLNDFLSATSTKYLR